MMRSCMTQTQNAAARRGFSLIELVIVIVIIGIIAAIAIPRVTKGAQGAEVAAAKSSLQAFRSAIDAYRAEPTSSAYPTNAAALSTAIAPAYLHSIPTLKLGALNSNTIVDATSATPGVVAGGAAWAYWGATGTLWVNVGTGADWSGNAHAW
jgi:general secretion pathway protein G